MPREADDCLVKLTCITIDCADPEVVANFWNDALGWGGVTFGDAAGLTAHRHLGSIVSVGV